jgi:uncharacterized protein YfbU (UPF0304 family)
MVLSDGEKLILVMLSDLYKHLEVKGEIDPELVQASIFNDKLWGLKWEYGSLFNAPQDNPPDVQETADILDMYRWITPAYEKLSQEEKDRIKAETTHWADYVKFKGFDANNDEHYGIVSYLVKTLGRYDELKDTYLNSHSQAELGIYRRMLKHYKTIERDFPRDPLTADQIIAILKAGQGPAGA